MTAPLIGPANLQVVARLTARVVRLEYEQFAVRHHLHRKVAALYRLRTLAVQPVPDFFDRLQIATLCHFDQFSSDGAHARFDGFHERADFLTARSHEISFSALAFSIRAIARLARRNTFLLPAR